jgi:hypothetical protein
MLIEADHERADQVVALTQPDRNKRLNRLSLDWNAENCRHHRVHESFGGAAMVR